jgi:succinate dehydrogenase / fumarate reductase iron-sulfur subunit
MQALVGIVRTESEMQDAIRKITALRERASRVGVDGHREFNAGWHTCIDLRNLLDVSEAIARSAIERKESRGGHFREDFPDKKDEFATFNFGSARQADGTMRVFRIPLPPIPPELQAGHRGAETVSQATFSIWRSEPGGAGAFKDYTIEISDGMVVLDAFTRSRPSRRPDLACRWNCKAGKCGSCSAEINGKPRLMCMSRLNSIDLTQPVKVEPMRTFPLIKDLVTDVSWNFRVKKGLKKFKPRPPMRPTARGGWRSATSIASRNSASASSASCARTSATCCAITTSTRSSSARASSSTPAQLEMHPLDTDDRPRRSEGQEQHRLLQHHQVLHQGVPGAHPHYGQRDHPLKERVVDRFYDPVTRLLRMITG